MQLRLPLSGLILASLAAAQPPTHISPMASASALGNLTNSIPFSWSPTAYQQVHSANSFSNPSSTLFTQLRLRMGNGSTNVAGASIDVELFMAESPYDAESASDVFASNVTGAELRVFTRKWVALPRVLDNSWAVAPFFFDTPFPWNATNLSWRVIVHGNSMGNRGFSYPLDAWVGSTPSVSLPLGTGCKAANGASPALHSVSGLGLGASAQYVGRSFVAAGGLPAFLTLGASRSSLHGIPLPFDLLGFGAPGCSLYNDWGLVLPGVTAPGTSGAVTTVVPIPNDQALAGSTHYSQYVFVSPGANAFGFFTTNGAANAIGGPVGVTRIYALGNPAASTGVVETHCGLAIGLN